MRGGEGRPAGPGAVVSIHDVTPGTLPQVADLVDRLRPVAGSNVCLLVVPGAGWSEAGVSRLRAWAQEGMELAGHGWVHHGPPRTLYHRVHGLVMSRDQAEHLSRPREELLDLVRRGFDWFRSSGLPDPGLYVPPAWALGHLSRDDLRRLPYRWYEVLSGYVDAASGRRMSTPLVGFEADTPIREGALRILNRLNGVASRLLKRPLRIGLHPGDLSLRLAPDVLGWVTDSRRHLTTAEAVAALRGGPDDPLSRPG